MSERDEEVPELSPDAKAFLSRHAATAEPTADALARGKLRLASPPVPQRRKRARVPGEVLAAAAVVVLLLAAQLLYLVLRPAPVTVDAEAKAVLLQSKAEAKSLEDTKAALPRPVAAPTAPEVKAGDLKAVVEAWRAGDFSKVSRLASKDCRSAECRPMVSELGEMLGLAAHVDALNEDDFNRLSAFDRKLSEGHETALKRQLENSPAARSRAEALLEEGRAERQARNYERAALLLEKCIRIAPGHHACYRQLGSVYAAIATRDQSASDMEKARKYYEQFLEVAPADDEYVPRVRAILDAASGDSGAPAHLVFATGGELRFALKQDVARLSVADEGIARAELRSPRSVSVRALKEGMTSLTCWYASGASDVTLLEVLSPETETVAPRNAEPLADGTPAMRMNVPAGGAGEVKFDREIARIAVGDTDIADVSPRDPHALRVKGISTGTTTLLVWFVDGTRETVNVEVSQRPTAKASSTFAEATRAKLKGDWALATALALKVLATDPNHAGARAMLDEGRSQAREAYLRGYQLRETQPEKALEFFKEVLRLTSADDDLHLKAQARVTQLEKK